VIPEIVAPLASGIFAGAALYTNFVEQPSSGEREEACTLGDRF
jgi:hypothetical protein